MAVCSKCGKEQYYGEKFCYSCKAPIIAEGKSKGLATSEPTKVENIGDSCPHCGARLADISRFCVSCGAALPTSAETPNTDERCVKNGNTQEIRKPTFSYETQIVNGQENHELYPRIRKISLRLRVCLLIGASVFLLWLILAHDIFVAALTMGILLWGIPYGIFYLIFRFVSLKKAKITGTQYRNIRSEMKKLPKSVSNKTN